MERLKMTRNKALRPVLRARVFVGVSLCAALCVFLCGCDRGPSLAQIEENERNSRLYTNAMDDLQSGRMDAAIKGFERVVLQEPKSYSAHFQLATLLQDLRKDYISAIAHYRAYLALRPASDKATVAQDRVKLCETLLSAEILRKAGGSASNKLAADNESLTAQVKALGEELAKAKRDVQRLEAEVASKHRLLAKLSVAVEAGGSARNTAIKEALASVKAEDERNERRSINPTDAELLDGDDAEPPTGLGRAKAAAAATDRGGATSRLDAKELADAKTLAADADATPRPPTAAPASGAAAKKPALDALLASRHGKPAPGGGTRPDTYVVQSGDTLYKIAKRFYGSQNMWQSIQRANRAIISTDGKVRPGQTIKLP